MISLKFYVAREVTEYLITFWQEDSNYMTRKLNNKDKDCQIRIQIEFENLLTKGIKNIKFHQYRYITMEHDE